MNSLCVILPWAFVATALLGCAADYRQDDGKNNGGANNEPANNAVNNAVNNDPPNNGGPNNGNNGVNNGANNGVNNGANNGDESRCAEAVDKLVTCGGQICEPGVFDRDSYLELCAEDPEGFGAEALAEADCVAIHGAICASEGADQVCDCSGEGTLTCADILSCFQDCDPDDQACLEACYYAGSPRAQAQYGALAECVQESCPEQDQMCLDTNCREVIDACFEVVGDALTCAEMNSCFQDCEPDDNECYQGCYDRASPQAQQDYQAIAMCVQENCPDQQPDCLAESCNEELAACFPTEPAQAFCLDTCEPDEGDCPADLVCVEYPEALGGVCVAGSREMPSLPPNAASCAGGARCRMGQICVPGG